MDRHKTHKHTNPEPNDITQADRFKDLLDSGAQEAYKRPWHRIERGLRLNRLRIFIEEVAPQYHMTDDEKKDFFTYLQKALDKKLLNTIKVVQYEPETQRIVTIKGLEMKRNQEGVLKWILKQKTEGTRKKKKDEPSVSTQPAQESSENAKIEEHSEE
jgi:hypothetical protein